MKKYIVTGGQGFIGSKIVKKVDARSYDLKSGQDVLDQGSFKAASAGCDGVFHCAAKISVPESVKQKDEYYKNNVLGTKLVAQVAEQNNQKIVFSSSAAVYGDTSAAITENFEFCPKSPYAENKIDGEEILKKLKTPAIALRYFNVYGPGQSDAYAGVITAFIKKALKNEDIVIYGDGQQVRDFVFVDDVAEANIVAMNYDNKIFDVFNIKTVSTRFATRVVFSNCWRNSFCMISANE
jgi:UDP-glucose 4-epimerase